MGRFIIFIAALAFIGLCMMDCSVRSSIDRKMDAFEERFNVGSNRYHR